MANVLPSLSIHYLSQCLPFCLFYSQPGRIFGQREAHLPAAERSDQHVRLDHQEPRLRRFLHP